MNEILSPDGLLSLLTLTILEIILGIDNIIFISLLSQNLKGKNQSLARRYGILLALVFRILMLFGISWLIGLTTPIFNLQDHSVSGRDLILFFGGVFLLAKASSEIFKKVEGVLHSTSTSKAATLTGVIVQIGLLDIVFSFDSVLTAIGMAEHISIMITAVIISMLVMLTFASAISKFIQNHISLQILALGFLILIGAVLVAESAHVEIPKPYVYCSVGFALVVQLLSIRAKKNKQIKAS